MKKALFFAVILVALILFIFIGIKTGDSSPDALDNTRAIQALVDAGYVKDNTDILKKYGIIDDNTDEYITVRDALVVFIKAAKYEVDKADLGDWYLYDELRVLDDTIDDKTKNILMSLAWVRGKLVTPEEIPLLDYDADITELEALRCAIRFVGDIPGCTGDCEEAQFSEKEDIYNRACEKGLIESPGYKNAHKPILRKDFYDIIHRALYVQFERGSADGVFEIRYIDRFIEK